MKAKNSKELLIVFSAHYNRLNDHPIPPKNLVIVLHSKTKSDVYMVDRMIENRLVEYKFRRWHDVFFDAFWI